MLQEKLLQNQITGAKKNTAFPEILYQQNEYNITHWSIPKLGSTLPTGIKKS